MKKVFRIWFKELCIEIVSLVAHVQLLADLNFDAFLLVAGHLPGLDALKGGNYLGYELLGAIEVVHVVVLFKSRLEL